MYGWESSLELTDVYCLDYCTWLWFHGQALVIRLQTGGDKQ